MRTPQAPETHTPWHRTLRMCLASVQRQYERKRREGQPHWVALTALARQLCKVVFKMLTSKSPYATPCGWSMGPGFGVF